MPCLKAFELFLKGFEQCLPGFNLVLVKANHGQRELPGLRPLQQPEAGHGAADHQGVPRHGVLFSTVKAFRQLKFGWHCSVSAVNINKSRQFYS